MANPAIIKVSNRERWDCMVKIPRVVSGLAYVAGMLGLAALILFYGSPGATVARNYAAYNG